MGSSSGFWVCRRPSRARAVDLGLIRLTVAAAMVVHQTGATVGRQMAVMMVRLQVMMAALVHPADAVVGLRRVVAIVVRVAAMIMEVAVVMSQGQAAVMAHSPGAADHLETGTMILGRAVATADRLEMVTEDHLVAAGATSHARVADTADRLGMGTVDHLAVAGVTNHLRAAATAETLTGEFQKAALVLGRLVAVREGGPETLSLLPRRLLKPSRFTRRAGMQPGHTSCGCRVAPEWRVSSAAERQGRPQDLLARPKRCGLTWNRNAE